MEEGHTVRDARRKDPNGVGVGNLQAGELSGLDRRLGGLIWDL